MALDLTDLELFLAVVEAGSITHGARRVHLALPSASARVRGMEATLGTPLLERRRRGVEPTPAGRALAHHAREVMGQIERLHGDLGRYAAGLRAQVRVLSDTAALTEVLPGVLAGYLVAHPQVDVVLEGHPSHAILEAIAAGRADVGVVADPPEAAGLETVPMCTDRLVVVAPPGHPLAMGGGDAPELRIEGGVGGEVEFAEVMRHPLVGLAGGSALQAHVDGHARLIGRAPVYRVRVPGVDAVCRMVAAGVGIAIVPRAAAERALAATAAGRASTATGPLAVLALTDAWATRELTACVRSRSALTPQAAALLDALASSG